MATVKQSGPQLQGPCPPSYLKHLENPPVGRLVPPLPVIQGVEGPDEDLGRGLLGEEQRLVLFPWVDKAGRAGVRGWLGLQETLASPTSPPNLCKEGKTLRLEEGRQAHLVRSSAEVQ